MLHSCTGKPRPPRITTQRLVLVREPDRVSGNESDDGGDDDGHSSHGSESSGSVSDSKEEDEGRHRCSSSSSGSAKETSESHNHSGARTSGASKDMPERTLSFVLATRKNLSCSSRHEYLCRWKDDEGEEGHYSDSWVPASTLRATDSQMQQWVRRNQGAAAVIDAGEFAGTAGQCFAEHPAMELEEDDSEDEDDGEEIGVAAPPGPMPREQNIEVYHAEVEILYQITAWRDAARERGRGSAQHGSCQQCLLASLTPLASGKANLKPRRAPKEIVVWSHCSIGMRLHCVPSQTMSSCTTWTTQQAQSKHSPGAVVVQKPLPLTALQLRAQRQKPQLEALALLQLLLRSLLALVGAVASYH